MLHKMSYLPQHLDIVLTNFRLRVILFIRNQSIPEIYDIDVSEINKMMKMTKM